MPTHNPDFRPYTASFGSLRQRVRSRFTGWFRPTHPRFGLHLFLIALASGLLLSLAWLAAHGIAQQFRHVPVAAGASIAGPGSPLPTPMAGGTAALSAVGAGRASSWTIQEGGQPAADSATATGADSNSVAPDATNVVNASGETPMPADDGATTPRDEVAADAVPAAPPSRDAVRIGQTEVTLLVQIDEQGNPTQVTVLNSSGSAAVDNAALLTVQNRHFPPVLHDGEPVPATLTIPLQMQTPMQDR